MKSKIMADYARRNNLPIINIKLAKPKRGDFLGVPSLKETR